MPHPPDAGDSSVGGLVMRPDEHEVLSDGQWIKAMRQETGHDLFVYRHRRTRRFVVAEWMVKPVVYGQGLAVCLELCTMSGPPDRGPPDRPSKQWMRWRCRPMREVRRERVRRQAGMMQDEQELRDDSDAERRDTARWLRKKGLEEAAYELEMGCTPYIGKREGGSLGEQVTDEISRTAGDRIISDPGDKGPKPKHRSFD
jgi:hypothetical protein